MYKQADNLILTDIKIINNKLHAASGLTIEMAFSDRPNITIADIFWDSMAKSCFIQTVKDNFQNYIVSYDDFKNFIYLVDSAYDIIENSVGKKWQVD